MKRVRLLFINMLLLTATSLLMRTIGLSFRVYLSNKIGSTGIGLFQLIMSIYMLAITFSTSGIKLATTRLVAEELGIQNNFGAKAALRTCLFYSIFFGSVSAIILYFSADYIGNNLLCDSRTILSLQILAFSLPFIAITSVFNGYFTAVRRVVKSAAVQFSEQFIKISVTVWALNYFMPTGIEYACVAIVLGTCIGEFSSFVFLSALYLFDVKRYKSNYRIKHNIAMRMLNITIPVALSSYARSALTTIEHLLIPRGFKKSGVSSDLALAAYGTIEGMVIPIIVFPSALLNVISDLLVPELAECKSCGSKVRINYIITRIFRLGLLFSIGIMGILFYFSKDLGFIIYKNNAASNFIRILSPLVPIIYLDIIVDGMLKGLGEQVSSMRYNVLDSLISVILIYILLPKYAINGYVFTIAFTEIFNFWLSVNRLIKVTDFKISLLSIIKPLFCFISSVSIYIIFLHFTQHCFQSEVVALIINITSISVIYIFLLYILTCITYDDLYWLKSIIK